MNEYVGTAPDIIEMELNMEINPCTGKHKITILCEDIRKFWVENYLIKDIDMIDFPLGLAVTHMLPGDPVWGFLVAQSSSLKSEIIRSFGEVENDYIHPSSKLTENAILSGSHEETLADRLNGKIWIFKDLTTLLGMRHERLEVVAGNMREIYDGYITMDSGKLNNSVHVKVHTTMIAGVTPDVIDGKSRLFKAEVGERVLHKRFEHFKDEDSDKLLEFLEQDEFKVNVKRKEISLKMSLLLEEIFKQKKKYDECDYDIKIKNKDTQKLIMNLAKFLAKMRISVMWDFKQENIDDIGTPEGPARLYLQLKKLAAAFMIVKGKEEIDDIVLTSISKVVMDTMPRKRFVCLLPFIVNNECWKENKGIDNMKMLDYGKLVHGMGQTTITRKLQELEEMNVLTNTKPYNGKNKEKDEKIDIEKEMNKDDSMLKKLNKRFNVKQSEYISTNSWYLTKEFIKDNEAVLNFIKIAYKNEYVPKSLT